MFGTFGEGDASRAKAKIRARRRTVYVYGRGRMTRTFEEDASRVAERQRCEWRAALEGTDYQC
jgi:hypothetical protein